MIDGGLFYGVQHGWEDLARSGTCMQFMTFTFTFSRGWWVGGLYVKLRPERIWTEELVF
jgi:hypothetical protein